jgi:NADP-dependent 3-hydroxy acid dehydrogenase YdfG
MAATHPSDAPVWLITGSSSGIGRGLVEVLGDEGRNVVATAREVSAIEPLAVGRMDHVRVHALDLLDQQSITETVSAALEWFGRIDVLVSAAGTGLIGSVEESSTDEVRRLFETNVFGTHRVLSAVIAVMREQKSGHVAAITSHGAFHGQPGCAPYCGSKAALNAILEGLYAEVAPLGIGVTIIEPGLVRSDFRARAIVRSPVQIADYEPTCGPLRRAVEAPIPVQALDPRAVASAIVAALSSPRPPLHLPIGADALQTIRSKLSETADELDRWQELSLLPTAEKPPPAGGT